MAKTRFIFCLFVVSATTADITMYSFDFSGEFKKAKPTTKATPTTTMINLTDLKTRIRVHPTNESKKMLSSTQSKIEIYQRESTTPLLTSTSSTTSYTFNSHIKSVSSEDPKVQMSTAPTGNAVNVGVYKIQDENNNTCFWFEASLSFYVNHINQNGHNQATIINFLPNEASTNGTCFYNNSSDAVMVINWSNTCKIQLRVRKNLRDWYIEQIYVEIKRGPQSEEKTTREAMIAATISNAWLYRTPLNHSYQCKEEKIFNLTKHVRLHMRVMRMQPFLVKKDGFETSNECSPTSSKSNVTLKVVIGLGFFLVFLFIFITIYYFLRKDRTYSNYKLIT